MFHGEERCADVELYCSRWLAAQCGADERLVCWQGVPAPEGALVGRERRNAAREVGAELVVGRLCTPQARKWPALLAGFYRDLAQRVPETRWEFVGCPAGLQRELHEACGGRVRFLPAGWQARAHLWRWDAMLYHNPELAESFGRVCAEAMLAGCVPLVDRSGGFVEQVAQGCGYLCDGVEEFAAALEALRDARRRAETAARARAHAERHFSLAAFGERMLEWLEAGAATA